MSEVTLGSVDANVLPMDAFTLSGKASDAARVMGLEEPWIYGTARATRAWVEDIPYIEGDVVYHESDELSYLCLADTDSIEPDYSDSIIEGVTWQWIGGVISGYVSGRGWWTKFANGLLIQEFSWESGTGVINNFGIGTYGWSFYSNASKWVFPVPFVGDPYRDVHIGGSVESAPIVHGDLTLTSVMIGYRAYASASRKINGIAIGRWKE